MFRVRVAGDASLLTSGKTLIVANQDSWLDGVLLALFLPGKVTIGVSRADLRFPLLRLLMRALPHIVIEASRPLSLKRLMHRLKRGVPVAVFPQAQPTVTGSLMKIYDSAALIAARCNAQIVPVRVSGTLYSRYSAVGGNFPKLRFPRVTLTILPPHTLPVLPPLPAKVRRRRLAEALLRIMEHMMFASQPRRTLFAALLDAAELHGYRTRILEDVQGEHTYRDIVRTSLALGRVGARLSGEGEIVGVMMPNLVATVALLLGLGMMR